MLLYFFGEGKGKTTAGIGSLMRAYLYGKKVLLINFLKKNTIENKLPFDVFDFGPGYFVINGKADAKHRELTKKAFDFFIKEHKKYDVIMLDELSIALYYKLLDEKKVIDFLKNFSGKGYPVCIATGRKKNNALIDIADTVSEIKEIKHAYEKNIPALKGIDY